MISESGGRNYHGCSLGIYQPGDPRRLRCSGVRSGGGGIHQLVTSTDGTSGATRALRRTAAHSGALPRYDFSPGAHLSYYLAITRKLVSSIKMYN